MESISSVLQYFKSQNYVDFKRTVVYHLDNKKSVIKLLNNNCIWLHEISKSLQQDRDISLLAVKKDGRNFEYLQPEFLNDREVILTALKSKYADYSHIAQNVDNGILNEPDIAETLLKKYTYALKYLNQYYQDNRELILKLNVINLEDMSQRLKHDKEVVLQCVSSWGNQLQFASADLQDDSEVVIEALKCNGLALEFASERLRSDLNIIKLAMRHTRGAVMFMSDYAKSNKEIIQSLIKNDLCCLQYASPELQTHFMNL